MLAARRMMVDRARRRPHQIVQVSPATTWAHAITGSPQTASLDANATVGNVVAAFVSFDHSAVSTISGLGATWAAYLSRDGSNDPFPTAAIYVGTVVTAGTDVTITFPSGFRISAGLLWLVELANVSATPSSTSTASTQTSSSTPSSVALSASAGDVYLEVITFGYDTVGAPSSVTDSPSSFDETVDMQLDDYSITGLRIARGAETPKRSAVFPDPDPFAHPPEWIAASIVLPAV